MPRTNLYMCLVLIYTVPRTNLYAPSVWCDMCLVLIYVLIYTPRLLWVGLALIYTCPLWVGLALIYTTVCSRSSSCVPRSTQGRRLWKSTQSSLGFRSGCLDSPTSPSSTKSTYARIIPHGRTYLLPAARPFHLERNKAMWGHSELKLGFSQQRLWLHEVNVHPP